MKASRCLLCELLTLVCLCHIVLVSGTSIDTVKKLHTKLLENYNKNVRPVKNQDKPLKVEFGMSLVEIAQLDKETGSVLVNAWIQMSWQDDQLRWSSKEYQGTTQVQLPATSIWLPDIRLYNGMESEIDQSVNAVIESNGHVTVVIPAKYRVTCHHEFRGNVWSCFFKFGSWTYTGTQMDIVPKGGRDSIDESNNISSDYYAVISHSGERKWNKYHCCKEPYPSMEYTLKLRSKMGPSLLGRRRRK